MIAAGLVHEAAEERTLRRIIRRLHAEGGSGVAA